MTVGIYEDFARQKWGLYANGMLVTNALGFVNTTITNFTGFNVYNGDNTSYVDNVSVTELGSVTVNPGNLNCHVMQGVAASNLTFVIAAQTSVWSFVNTTSDAWLAVSPAAGIADSAVSGGTTCTVACAAMPNGSYTGTVTVCATNSDGVEQTRTVTVTLDVMELQVAPTNLAMTNGIMQGYAIPSQTCAVWNAGGGAFNYSARPLGDMTNWLSVTVPDPLVGSNTFTVQYASGLAPGDYTGTIEVASSDGGGATGAVRVAAQVVSAPLIELSTQVLTQSVDKGSYLVNQPFTIRNGSGAPVVPMAYTLTKSNGFPALIHSLSIGGGVSTGQANSVTVNYLDVSGLDAGVYTAWVNVVAWDPGNGAYVPTGTVHVSTTLVVKVTVVALDAPWGVTASDGTYTDKVTVHWNTVPGAANYGVYRSLTFDWTQAEPIGTASVTNFNDQTGLAGTRYYYWVSSISSYGGEGPLSTNRETGYRALSAPGGIFATDGAYTNKVRVTWPLVDGATGYRLYRGFEGATTLTSIYFTAGGVYEDMNTAPGVRYEYRVGATNGMFGSSNSVADIGYAFGVPENLIASKGAYVGKVRVTWDAVESASSYHVWRGTHAILPPGGGAVELATVVSNAYDDTSVAAGVTYYYWVRAVSLLAGTGGWSGTASGYGAQAGVDLYVSDLVVLPVQIGVGSSPAVTSFRMGNAGGTNMTGTNGTVRMEFFASTSQVFGAAGEISITNFTGQVTLGVGQEIVMTVPGTRLVMPGTDGDYYIFVRVTPTPPSLLVETDPDNNVARRNGSVRVRSSGGLNYHAFNDYDGDGMSDLGVYRGMEWKIRSVDGHVLVNGASFGGAGRPVLGDFDGDGLSDPMVFDSASGLWQIMRSKYGYALLSGGFGGAGDTALVADYEGVGHGDLSVVNAGNGRWSVLKTAGGVTEWNWGATGYQPVIGDYNGDGCWDMAVYQESTGLWFIRTLGGDPLVAGAGLGGPDYSPVPGDYDGDGCWDVAVYARTTGKWYIYSLAKSASLVWGSPWGGPGLEPVMGDYDGDGQWDLGLYQESSGFWYIWSLNTGLIAYESHWGGTGYRPIGN